MTVVNIGELIDQILNRGLQEYSLESTLEQLCEVLAEPYDLYRVSLGMPTLHPLVEAISHTWIRGQGVQYFPSEHGYSEKDDWLKSPVFHMFKHDLTKFHCRLDQPGEWQQFPILVDLRHQGCTDYYATAVSFNEKSAQGIEDSDGFIITWTTTNPQGFNNDFFQTVHQLLPAFGLVTKLHDRNNTTVNIVEAYIGKDAGNRVLQGQIERGKLISIEAVIWYSDMRSSTYLADTLSNQEFLDTLNRYFECTAGSILEQNGEVLRFIGDAVLGIFPYEIFGNSKLAAQSAWNASIQARKKLNDMNTERSASSKQEIDFGLALHTGTLDYGNIGVPTRLEFSVIGPVANEVARMESLTKQLREPVVVSETYSKLLNKNWRCLGPQPIKGTTQIPVLFAP